MTEDEFWALVEQCRERSRGDLTELARLLERRLWHLPVEEVLSFSDHWYAASNRSLAWPLWDAACVLLGWVIDDSFHDFRAWLISRGRASFEAVVSDPDNLADLADELLETRWGDAEQLDPVAQWTAYQGVTGELPPEGLINADAPIEPVGDRVELSDSAAVRERFPRLWEARLAREQIGGN